MLKKNKIVWEKWVDPFALDDIEEEGEEEEVEQDFPSYEQYESQEEQVNDEKMLLLYSEMGIIPYNEKTSSGKIFNFWIGHTNFDITQKISVVIESVPGVEILDIFTRYRFRIAIGKAFVDREVMNRISKELNDYFSIEQAQNINQNNYNTDD